MTVETVSERMGIGAFSIRGLFLIFVDEGIGGSGISRDGTLPKLTGDKREPKQISIDGGQGLFGLLPHIFTVGIFLASLLAEGIGQKSFRICFEETSSKNSQ